MNLKYNRPHKIDFIFPLTLLVIFVILSLTLALFAADVYKHNVDNSAKNNSARILLSYVTEKVHSSDNEGNVYVGAFDGHSALVIDQYIGGDKYTTYIYSYDNNLCELFIKADIKNSSDFKAANGTAIIESNNFQIAQLNDNQIIFSCDDSNNNTITQVVAIRSR